MANVMQELMDMKVWFLWRYATGKNSKMTKGPFAANGGATGTNAEYSSMISNALIAENR